MAAPTKTAPLVETYSIGAKPDELVAGKKQNVEMTIGYHRSEPPGASTNRTHRVEFSSPEDVTIRPTSWDFEATLTPTQVRFSQMGLFQVEVAADAAPGEREVTVTITAARGTTSTLVLKLRVAKKDG